MFANLLLFWHAPPGPPPPKPPNDLKLAIVEALQTDDASQALFGANIYPVIIPQTAPLGAPTLTYQFEDSKHDATLSAPAGVRYVDVLFTASSAIHADVETAREVLRAMIQGFRGTLAGVPIIGVWFELESDGYDEPIAAPISAFTRKKSRTRSSSESRSHHGSP